SVHRRPDTFAGSPRPGAWRTAPPGGVPRRPPGLGYLPLPCLAPMPYFLAGGGGVKLAPSDLSQRRRPFRAFKALWARAARAADRATVMFAPSAVWNNDTYGAMGG